ncbi:hypothetical protein G647_07512 [Cladophialophora carrionii CBS 160.54]|uniref:Oxidoreductase-like domain-containing protein n=1 Tax=Cladophialophora carrionii CBS 160.54 TaxID=1279043 RepID=V9D4E9_9EURO|nr:uncharacterized protein G647_07512 [Cladophialophora carrionii CBS 160.54]ETI21168.1 hypothetical protein G647_07512 [Cladophialophora carrionii CBS 160.54]
MACLRQQQRVQSRKLSTSGFQSDPLPQESRDKALQRSVVGSSRPLHTSRPLCREADQQRQAVPLGDFYTDILANPTPKKSKEETSLPTFVQSGDKSKEERAKMLFGSIEGSGYERHTYDKPDNTWRTINGVPVPPRPAEPDNCCMSGCVHCVWDDYRDDIESWASRVAEAQAKSPKKRAHGRTPKIEMSRPEVDNASGSMDDDGGGSEALWTTPSSSTDEDDVLFQGIPVGIRHFMATEKRIRERRRAKREKGASVDDYE